MAVAKQKNAQVWERETANPLVRDVPAFDHRRALEIGVAGEHLVCADLLLAGYRAFQGSQGAPYDVVVEIAGRLVRLTVKSTSGPRPRPGREGSRGIYQFAVGRRKRDHRGKTSARAYDAADVDIVACVALDTWQIAYLALADCPTMVQFEAPHGVARSTTSGPRYATLRRLSDHPFSDALERIGGRDADR